MNGELAVVLILLLVAIAMFAIGRPRMDVVGILVIVALPLTGILTVDETLAGFADPNVILIAALFVVGEGLSRTGVTYRLGDWLARTAGASATRLIVLLMLSVALLGAVMSSTGVVAIFIPVVLSIAARTGMSARQLMMPLSFAGLISGMLTLIATAPNLVVNAELIRDGSDGFGFFSFTPFGLVVLILGIGYMLFARRFLDRKGTTDAADRRSTFETLTADYNVDGRTHRYKVQPRSSLAGLALAELDLGTGRRGGALILERSRLFRRTVHTTADNARIERGDVIVTDVDVRPEDRGVLGLEEIESGDAFFETYSRQVGLGEVLIAPDSSAIGKSVRGLRFRDEHDLIVLGVRHVGRAAGASFSSLRLAAGDTLLVAGPWSAISRLQGESRDYLVLDLPVEGDEVAPASNQAPFAILSVVVMIVLMVTGVVPNVVAALIAALLMGIFGCIDMPSAYRAIHWPTLLLIVGMMPFALALQRTGGVDLIVNGLLTTLGGAGPRVLLAGIFALTAIIGLFVSNTATAVLMAPIAIGLAHELGMSPYPFAMIVALAASSAFMTPVSSPVNTLVVEPGRYTFFDFVKVGTPFTIIVLIVSVLLVPVILPL
ncbi:SLC13 family permease [Microbacterium ulmi]|uniref:SLC13 family permease n=1 Tax=Microbacterium ulmi TaxID=179095 RepID=A0A7Y2Q0X0_9MICO|nr:SLC13 family permease [Microbacterium ulmi]NII68418.1 di/tricarboxylate transporter [Microbacterium ulmi]NNH03058.1 SLC13 family permease [Microbacterium ulmi]